MLLIETLILAICSVCAVFAQYHYFDRQARRWRRRYWHAGTENYAFYCLTKIQACRRCARFFAVAIPFTAFAVWADWRVLL